MMAGGTAKSHQLTDAPAWVFPWRRAGTPLFPKLFAAVFVGAAFTFLITTIRVRVVALEKSPLRKAAVIYLRDDAQGRALGLRAREGGPFPSRFEPAQWEGLPGLEAAALDAARFQPPPYVPALGDLPAESLVLPLKLAAAGESFFPKRSPAPANTPALAKLKLAPALSPLSGVTAVALPPFEAAVDTAMSSVSWRFLVRLNPDGGVAECVSLEKGGEPGTPELEAWLRRVRFTAEPAKPFRWIAVAVGFTNQAADGTDPR